ncbi:hypothetical protein P3T76_003123 [Phytophthora citrophthora]|uniref:Uncharacterized protein n=1 Tax=Phytophthora citrophthora TaxID=4793 RepID=A0AAD9GW34_9STRA|nr:hypothetical protein P3T76_003123 [Phytophthora citrophthora]
METPHSSTEFRPPDEIYLYSQSAEEGSSYDRHQGPRAESGEWFEGAAYARNGGLHAEVLEPEAVEQEGRAKMQLNVLRYSNCRSKTTFCRWMRAFKRGWSYK